jgi:hypothetical protein
MPANPIVLIDTSVLCTMLKIPGHFDPRDAESISSEFEELQLLGARFILPVTALIEIGNFVAQASIDRRGLAERFCKLISEAQEENPPWTIRDVNWNREFIESVVAGSTTGVDLLDHLTNQSLGTGDIAILVERDLIMEQTAYTDVRIWTRDAKLASFSSI